MRNFRWTLRARLASTYAGLLTLAGALMMLVVYVVVGFLPTYAFSVAATTSSPLSPVITTYDRGIAATTTMDAIVVSSRDDVLHLILVIASILLVLLAGGGAWAGWVIAGRMLRPLQEVNAAAHLAARGHLDHRIALQGPRDEVSDLADTFDEMLDGLERSFATYRRFAANASHELRTPLATTRAMLDVARTGNPASDRQLLDRLHEMNERSIQTVESLLDLSEVDAARPAHRPVDLEHITTSVLTDVADEAEESGVNMTYDPSSAIVVGDPMLLRQLVTNLAQNAIRHNAPGGWVMVTTTTTPQGVATLTVENTGARVSESAIESLTAPFFRAKGRSTDSTSRGRGLGLSIVAAIVERHDAVLQLDPRGTGGLLATVTFPNDEKLAADLV